MLSRYDVSVALKAGFFLAVFLHHGTFARLSLSAGIGGTCSGHRESGDRIVRMAKTETRPDVILSALPSD